MHTLRIFFVVVGRNLIQKLPFQKISEICNCAQCTCFIAMMHLLLPAGLQCHTRFFFLSFHRPHQLFFFLKFSF